MNRNRATAISLRARPGRFAVFAAVIWLVTPTAFAGIQLRTNIQDVHYRGLCNEAGAVTMSVDSNAFPNATEATPTFIVFRLALGATLCQSLVHVDGPGTSHYPIALAMRLEGTTTGTTISAHPNTVSIVRWVRGESAIWFRVSSPSSTWVTVDAVQQPPSPTVRVAWTFGHTARNSYNRNFIEYENGRANRMANQRVGGELPMEQMYVSTLLGVDLSDADMQPMPEWNSQLEFDIYLADADSDLLRTTPPPENFHDAGQGIPVFGGDDVVARGFDLDLEAYMHSHSSTTDFLCVDDAINGLIPMDGWFRIWTFGYKTKFVMRLHVPQDATYGFPTGNLIQGETYVERYQWWGNNPFPDRPDYYEVLSFSAAARYATTVARAYADGDFIMTPAGERLAKTVEVEISGIPYSYGGLMTTINFELAMDYRDSPTQAQVFLDCDYFTFGPENRLDESPFEQTQQFLPTGPEMQFSDDWVPGAFEACPDKKATPGD